MMRDHTPPLDMRVIAWCAAFLLAIILSTSYLLDGPSETQSAQDVSNEVSYAAAQADGGTAHCAALGRVPQWTPNGDLICRLKKSQLPLTVAQAAKP